jgi:hypothetical protein
MPAKIRVTDGTTYVGDLTISADERIDGVVDGQVVVEAGGVATVAGIVTKGLVVAEGGIANVFGTVRGLLIERGGQADLYGIAQGRVENQGLLTIQGIVEGHLVTHPSASTSIDPRAVVNDNRDVGNGGS